MSSIDDLGSLVMECVSNCQLWLASLPQALCLTNSGVHLEARPMMKIPPYEGPAYPRAVELMARYPREGAPVPGPAPEGYNARLPDDHVAFIRFDPSGDDRDREILDGFLLDVFRSIETVQRRPVSRRRFHLSRDTQMVIDTMLRRWCSGDSMCDFAWREWLASMQEEPVGGTFTIDPNAETIGGAFMRADGPNAEPLPDDSVDAPRSVTIEALVVDPRPGEDTIDVGGPLRRGDESYVGGGTWRVNRDQLVDPDAQLQIGDVVRVRADTPGEEWGLRVTIDPEETGDGNDEQD